jgi:IS5 family transposase
MPTVPGTGLDWIEEELSVYYSDTGRPSVPIRTMVGMLLLKQFFDQSDESVLARIIHKPTQRV